MWSANIFSHSTGCLFTLLLSVLWYPRVLNFDGVQFTVFFCCLCFGIIFEEIIAKSNTKKLFLMFSSQNYFIVLALTFRSFTHFELIFHIVYGKYKYITLKEKSVYWAVFQFVSTLSRKTLPAQRQSWTYHVLQKVKDSTRHAFLEKYLAVFPLWSFYLLGIASKQQLQAQCQSYHLYWRLFFLPDILYLMFLIINTFHRNGALSFPCMFIYVLSY